MDSKRLQREEKRIQKLMHSFDYDRENAIKALEIQKIRNVEMIWGSVCGAAAVYKLNPFFREMSMSYGMMRKAWMRYPLPLAVFLFTYNVAIQVPQKLGRKVAIAPRVTHDVYTGETDLVGRFRFYDETPIKSSEDSLNSYVSSYATEALTEPEIMNKIQSAA